MARRKRSLKKFAEEHSLLLRLSAAAACLALLLLIGVRGVFNIEAYARAAVLPPPAPKLDRALYDRKMWQLAHNGESATTSPDTATSTRATSTKTYLWPVKAAYPLPGAILPFKRVVAYYGNFYSKQMGILGEFDAPTVLAKLRSEAARWEIADPQTPVKPAIEYIAVTAQGSAGADGMYRLRMPDSQIDHAIELAKEVDGIVILDVQIGLSDLRSELPALEKYLKMPQVHLALDPEFSMKTKEKPGSVIGTYDAADINYAAEYLARLVRENHLPPKILIVHRFTQAMVTGYRRIQPLPEVQIVMVMDGWGPAAKKINTYNSFIYPEPVQFTGFKIFYKNDMRPPSTRLITPAELLDLKPRPIFIQYQ